MPLPFYADGKDGVFDSTLLNHEPTTIAAGRGTEHNLKPQRWISSFVTPNQITSAIAASEKSRLRCSVAVALLDVLSNLRFPLLGSNFTRSVIISRPLYLDLLTNVAPVLAPLLFNNHRAFEGAVEAENKIPSTGGSGTDWTGQAGDALEVAPEGT
ncbi:TRANSMEMBRANE PROTEIN [Salix purpurea]|uniref:TRANSMEMBRANE PROTEIN n=1 Tax=Salix purpurea TaxID=77065 RepID=A0A9Q0T2D9_SALPP|nr:TRANSMEMBRANE PROTEIN [Salix purpurea]